MEATDKERFEISRILDEVIAERDRQNTVHPKPCKSFIPKGINTLGMVATANYLKAENKIREKDGEENWIDTIVEEVYESAAESEWSKQRPEMIQALATIVRCIQERDKTYPPVLK